MYFQLRLVTSYHSTVPGSCKVTNDHSLAPGSSTVIVHPSKDGHFDILNISEPRSDTILCTITFKLSENDHNRYGFILHGFVFMETPLTFDLR